MRACACAYPVVAVVSQLEREALSSDNDGRGTDSDDCGGGRVGVGSGYISDRACAL